MTITQGRLKELVDYDTETGDFLSKTSRGNLVKGSICGYTSPKGYRYIILDRRSYLAHRLVWLFHFGSFPVGSLDHINQDKSDNRLENLRLCSNQENMRNRRADRGSSSLYKGVTFVKARNHWQANVDGIYLGVFKCEHEAALVYNIHAEKRHGSFSNLNNVFKNFEVV